jgi:prepilin-type N-terminal cleavage/methylation domain-containing protein/prepilin-type processing-associated H-X9-DG protein
LPPPAGAVPCKRGWLAEWGRRSGMAPSGGKRRAFTLVELLVVIAIIGILVGLMIPAVNMVRETGRRAKCLNNVKNIALAMQNYHSIHKQFPTNWGKAPENGGMTTTGQSWMVMILPQIEEGVLYKTIGLGEPLQFKNEARKQDNLRAAQQPIQTFVCPSDTHTGTMTNQFLTSGTGLGVTNYKAVGGANWEGTNKGEFRYRKQDKGFGGRNASQYDGRDKGDGVICRGYEASKGAPIPTADFEIRDGMSQTFLIGEAVPEYCGWSTWFWWNGVTSTCGIPLNYEAPDKPRRFNSGEWRDNWGFHSRHPGGANFAFCDGSARFITDEIDLDTYRALATIDGGELIKFE